MCFFFLKSSLLVLLSIRNCFLRLSSTVKFCCKQVKGGTPVGARKVGRFKLFGECAKQKKKELGR